MTPPPTSISCPPSLRASPLTWTTCCGHRCKPGPSLTLRPPRRRKCSWRTTARRVTPSHGTWHLLGKRLRPRKLGGSPRTGRAGCQPRRTHGGSALAACFQKDCSRPARQCRTHAGHSKPLQHGHHPRIRAIGRHVLPTRERHASACQQALTIARPSQNRALPASPAWLTKAPPNTNKREPTAANPTPKRAIGGVPETDCEPSSTQRSPAGS
jgi:hypothetical protein